MPSVVEPSDRHNIQAMMAFTFEDSNTMEDVLLQERFHATDLYNGHRTTTNIPTLSFLPAIPSNATMNFESEEESEGEEDNAEDLFVAEDDITADLVYLRPRITSHRQPSPEDRFSYNATTGGTNRPRDSSTGRRNNLLLNGRRRFVPLNNPPVSSPSSSGSNSNSSTRGDPEDRHYSHGLHPSPQHHRLRPGQRQSLPDSCRRTTRQVQNRIVEEIAADHLSYGCPTQPHTVLDFDVIMEDGGRYSSHYCVENILRNDSSVYCSSRSGVINILLQYCGTRRCHRMKNDKSCVLSRIVIKSPRHGFTAPCKEGMFFISHEPIDVDATSKFDQFTRADFNRYISAKDGRDNDGQDPAVWFSLSDHHRDVIDLDDRVCKYVLLKLLRAEHESENIDLQYVALIGYSGACSFGGARLC